MSGNRFRAALLPLLVVALAPLGLSAQVTAPARVPTAPPTSAAPGYVPDFGTMWTFDAPPLAYWKTRYDFSPDQPWLDHVRLAQVRLPGCSASFVSANGLVMSNHHCARQCITAASPADTDFMAVGFVAAALSDERKCQGLYVDQLESMQDVTARVQAKSGGATAAQQVAARDAEIRAIEAECRQATNLNCQVVTFYQGGRYSLYRYHRYGDVRLVMAPEEAISFYGGDPDNFTYPRFDIDLSLLRVYDADGRPFHPKDYLHWSAGGAQESELVFVVGNPGSTDRLVTMAQLEYLRDVQLPGQLASYRRNMAILQALSARGETERRRYENGIFSIANNQKRGAAYLAGLQDSALMARKRSFERDFRARIAADPKLRAEYGGAWDAIAVAERDLIAIGVKQRYYALDGSTLLDLAGRLVRLPGQLALPEDQRLPQYQGAPLNRLRSVIEGNLTVDPDVDRMQLAAWLTEAQRALGPQDPLLVALLAGRTPEAAAAQLVAGTRVGDRAFRMQLEQGGAAAIAASTDPLIVAARTFEPAALVLARRAAQDNAAASANAQKVGRALFAVYGTALPPDATFTLRISDGVVKGYPFNGTVAPYRTSFYGLYARSAEFDDKPPFQLPQRWKQHFGDVDGKTPLDFVSTNDIIGGNSGSPVINRNGEVVGLVFDSNMEGLPARFVFTDVAGRTVSVHSQAIIEALRKVYLAPRIADELQGRTAER